MHALLLALAVFLCQGQSADERYSYAAGLFERGLHEMAAKENAAFLNEFPNHDKARVARYRLALSLFELKRFDDAERELDQLVRLGKDFPFWREVSLRKGQCRYQQGDLEQAVPAFDVVLTDPAHELARPARFFKAECEFRRARFAAAAELYATLLDVADFARPALYGLCWSRFKLQDFAGAAASLDRFLQTYASDSARDEMRYLRGECALNTEHAADAEEYFQAITAGDYADDALLAQGYAAAARNDAARAAMLFRTVTERFPQSPLAKEALLQCGIHLLKSGDAAGAMMPLEKLATGATGKDRAEALYWLGTAQAKSRRGDDALKTFASALRDCDDAALKARIQSAQGDALFDLGKFAEATRTYEQAAAGENGDYALQSAALAALNAGDHERALKKSHELITRFPQSHYFADAMAVAAEAQFARKSYDEAEQLFAGVMRADSANKHAPRCLSRIGWCRYYRGDTEGAQAAFQDLVTQFPDDALAAEGSLVAAQCAVARKDSARARALLEQHLARYRASSFYDDGLLLMARVAKSEGDLDAALRCLNQLLAGTSTPLADRALFLLAETQEANHDARSAQATYGRLMSELPESPLVPQACYARAWCLKDAGDIAGAIAAIDQLLARQDAAELRAKGLELRAALARQSKQPDLALETIARYAREFGDRAELVDVALLAALTLEDAGREPEAAELLQQRLAKLAGDAAARVSFELGVVLRKQGNTSGSAAALERAEAAAQSPLLAANAAFERGELAFDAKDHATARACYLRALSKCGEDRDLKTKTLYKLGWVALDSEQFADAAKQFESAAELDASHPLAAESLFLAGEAAYRNQQWDDAITWLERARNDHPHSESLGNVLFRLGQAQLAADRAEASVATLEDLQRRFPDFANACEADLCLGQALEKTGKKRSARQVLARVVEKDKGVLAARARLAIGRMARDEGDREGALAEFLKVAILYAHDEEVGEALYRAGCLLEEKGERDKALQQFQELLKRFPRSAFAADAQKRLRSAE
ncbi:MAG: tetratricopeptide repeat protein [Planctomycetota bacterium]